MASGQAIDESVQSQAPQIVAQPTRGQLVRTHAQQGGQLWTKVFGAKSSGHEHKHQQGVQERLDPLLPIAQSRDPLILDLNRLVDLRKRRFPQGTVLADLLDVQQTSVGSKADLPQLRQALQPFIPTKLSLLS